MCFSGRCEEKPVQLQVQKKLRSYNTPVKDIIYIQSHRPEGYEGFCLAMYVQGISTAIRAGCKLSPITTIRRAAALS